jgi:superfamily I DNA/RNA helicase
MTYAGMFARLATSFSHDQPGPYDYVVVDEAQDVGVPELKFLSALATSHADSLFFAGDQGQRIFQLPFSWRSLGIDIRGRSRTLKINYRTSHQIRQQADRLLPPEVSDVDGDTQDRRGTISAFDGPAPIVQEYPNAELEQNAVAEWLTRITADGVKPEEIAILVRTGNQFERATLAITKAGLPFIQRQTISDLQDSKISVMTMHFAKGLEFRAVAVIACDDEVLPLQERIENVTDPGDLEEVYDTERHLLYVACTRARDFLFVTGVSPVSEFLEDFR